MVVPVPDQLEYISNADGTTTEFPYPKRFLQSDEIVVLLRDADGVDTQQYLNQHYSIAGSSWPNGGTVSFYNAPAAGLKVVRTRMTQAKQSVDLENKQRNDAKAVEVQLDRLTMTQQDKGRVLADLSQRAITVPYGEKGGTLKAAKSSTLLHVDASGNITSSETPINEKTLREDGDKALASLIGQAGPIEVPFYDTALALSFANVKPTVNAVHIDGYAKPSDGGDAALYRKSELEADKPGDIKSNHGKVRWGISNQVIRPQMLGCFPGDGPSDKIQQAISLGRKTILSPGVWNTTVTIHPVVDGQIIEGEGKSSTIITNEINALPIFNFRKDASETGWVTGCTLDKICLRGNTETINGIILPGIFDDGFVGGASRANVIGDIRLENVRGGDAVRISSWSNRIGSIEVWDSKRGVRMGSESNACDIGLLYISRCEEHAFYCPDGLGVPSSSNIGTLIAQYSGAEAYPAVDIQEHFGLVIGAMYTEGNKGSVNTLIHGGSGLSIGSLMYNRVTGDEADIVRVTGQGKAVNLGSITLLGGAMKCAVRVQGALPIVTVGAVHLAAGSFTESAVVDESTRKAVIYNDPLGIRSVPTTFRGLIGQNLAEYRRSDTDAVVGFVRGDGRRFYGPDVNSPNFARSGGTLSLYANNGTADFATLAVNRLRLGPDNVILAWGPGSPEGAVTANVGSIYLRTDTVLGLKFYVKETGTGNTGFVAK